MVTETKINLHFNPELHKYSNADTNEVLMSATQVLGKYKGEFNTRYWSMYTALKNAGLKPRQSKDELYITTMYVKNHINTLWANRTYERLALAVQAEWQHKTDVANKRGNKIHDYLEDSINKSRGDEQGVHNSLIRPKGGGNLPATHEEQALIIRTKHDLDATDLKETYPAIYDRFLYFINLGATIFAEKKVYSSTYGIAGMIDVLIILGNTFWILDWKTNKDEMHFQSGYYKKLQNQHGQWVRTNEYILKDVRLAYPLDALQDCKGISYSLQLSLYSYIMELWGYKPAKNHLEIFHIRPKMKPKQLNIRYYRNEIHAMLEHYKAGGLKTVDEVKEEGNKFGFGIS